MREEKDIQAIAHQLHEILVQVGVTLGEAEIIYTHAGALARQSPGMRELYDQYKNAPIKTHATYNI